MSSNNESSTPNAAAPALVNNVVIGSIGIRLTPHETVAGAYFLQARDVRFWSPRRENLDAALAFLGLAPAAAAEPVIGGMFAGCTVTEDELSKGNAVAAMLVGAVKAYLATIAVVVATGGETPEA